MLHLFCSRHLGFNYNPVVLIAIYMFGMPNTPITSTDNGYLSSLIVTSEIVMQSCALQQKHLSAVRYMTRLST